MDYIANNPTDFGLYFNTCFVGKPLKNGSYAVYKVHSRGEREETITLVNCENSKDQIKESWKTIVEDWLPVPLRVGMTNVVKTVYYISRSPRQQVKKGFTAEGNYAFWCPHAMLMDSSKVTKVSTAELALAAFNNKYLEIEELMEALKKGERIGGAISRYFGIYILPTFETNILTYKNNTIGSVQDGEFHVAKPYSLYAEALERAFSGRRVRIME